MGLDRSETAAALLVVTVLFGLFLAEPVPEDRLWIVVPWTLLFGASVFVVGVLHGVHRARHA